LIHTLRERGRLIPVYSGNECAKLELELFGYINGVFKGPIPRNGFFSTGKGGTILFEEIEKMPVRMQARLALALREGKFRKVGGDREIRFDVHILAMTEKDFLGEVVNGRFRGDLYFPLSEMKLHIPPLRERDRMDMELLAQHVLTEIGFERKLAEPAAITCGAMESLCLYDCS